MSALVDGPALGKSRSGGALWEFALVDDIVCTVALTAIQSRA
jgi:hypothetical protein